MISDRYEFAYKALIKRTNNREVKWRPIIEYIKDYVEPVCTDSDLAQHVQALYQMEWFELHLDESFYCYKDGKFLALLSYKRGSAKDGTIDEVIELVGCMHEKAMMTPFPEYIEGGFETLRKAIMDYWESKKMDYCLEVSDCFELLDTFIKQD